MNKKKTDKQQKIQTSPLIDRKKRGVIIPAYNEADHITEVIQGIIDHCDFDIIVIDDGSYDQTAKKAKLAGAYVIKHPFNMGYGVALQTGYKYALKNNYDIVVQMDGDGQHDPAFIPEFFNLFEILNCDVLIGSRFHCQYKYQLSIFKLIGIRLFRFILKIITKQSFADPTSGYQCLNRDVLRIYSEDSFPSDYPDANVLVMLFRMGCTVKETPVIMKPHPKGKSMHKGFFTVIYYLFKVLLSIFIMLIRDHNLFLQRVTNK